MNHSIASALAAFALAAFAGFLPLTREKSDSFCESLKKRSPELFKRFCILCGNVSNDESFTTFIVGLIYAQTKNSLIEKYTTGHLRPVCNTKFGCGCCESWNSDVRKRSLERATKDIKQMIEDSSQDFPLFHQYAQLALETEEKRQSENPEPDWVREIRQKCTAGL